MRTHPLTFLHDHATAEHAHDWHQLSYALRGHLELETRDARWLLPIDRALWVPAGTPHRELMRAPVSVRTLYLAPGIVRGAAARCRALVVGPLLRELVLHITQLGALDTRVAVHRHIAGLLVDLVASTDEVALDLPMPRDERARRFVALLEDRVGERHDSAALARRCGASLRTLERCFKAETGLALGEWQRRWRLFAALARLEAGASVTETAHDAGYAGPSAFTAAFRRLFGAPPSQHVRR